MKLETGSKLEKFLLINGEKENKIAYATVSNFRKVTSLPRVKKISN